MYFFISVAICDLVHIVETFISIKFTANSIWNFFLKIWLNYGILQMPTVFYSCFIKDFQMLHVLLAKQHDAYCIGYPH